MGKKYEAGQWWVDKDGNPMAFVVGFSASGLAVVSERINGGTPSLRYAVNACMQGLRHEPACTGWDWGPKKYPKWYRNTADERGHLLYESSPSTFHRALGISEDDLTPLNPVDKLPPSWVEISTEAAAAFFNRRKVKLTTWLCETTDGYAYTTECSEKPEATKVIPLSTREVEVPVW